MQHPFELAHLAVDLAQHRQLGEHQLVVALAKAMQVEHESAEIAIGELACLTQEARPPTHAPTLAKARRLLLGGRLGLRRLLPSVLCPVVGPVVGPCRMLLGCGRSLVRRPRRLLKRLHRLPGGLWCLSSCL